ncbi:MAG: glutamate 5-kinase [Ruminococcaceae bacterium]|nr:glutamate 5-kinase [Oscillospiraceae bacterium]
MKKNWNYSRIAVKIGSSTLTHENTGRLNIRRIEKLVRTISDIKNSGTEVVLISSGAIAAGASKLSVSHRDRSLAEKQALAAVGQPELMRLYERLFAAYGYNVGQILMTKDIVDDPHRLDLARGTFTKLFELSCVPIVNENDSISTEEIRFGDNDTLSAYVACVARAELLINLSDIDGLYDCDPHKNPDASLIDRVECLDDVKSFAGDAGTGVGTGGMVTKIRAAEIAGAAGIPMIITNGADPEILYRIVDGERIGTYFVPRKEK